MPKITNIEIIELGEEGEKSSPWSSTILVLRLTTSDGVVGYGETPTTLMTRPVYEQMREVARLFINKDVENINGNYFEFYKNSFYLPVSMESTSALSAFEIASWDIVGKIHGLPIYEILGGKVRDKIRAYANGWYNDCVTPEDFLSKAKIVESMGFTAVKFDPFGSDYHHLSEEGLLNAREIVSTIKNETNLDILIEYHGRFNANSAIRAINTLQEFDPIFHEEPVHPDELVGLRRVRDATDAPIALGERVLNKKEFLPFFTDNLVDIIQPDVTNVGGIREAYGSALLAEAFGAEVAYHNAFGPIQTAATLHLDSVIANFRIQESFEAFWPDWKKNLLKKGYKLDKGYFTLNDSPGLAIEVNERIIEEFKTDIMEPFNPSEPPWVVKGTFKR